MRLAWSLAAVAASVPVARVAAREFAAVHLPSRVRDLETIASELFTNVVRHVQVSPGQTVDLILEPCDGAIRVSVQDPGSGFVSPPDTPGPEQTSGWGLYLVDQIADRWGYERERGGFRVWAEIGSEDCVDDTGP